MKKGGLTTELVEAKLREVGGNLAAVGRAFGVTRAAVHHFVHKRPKLLAAANDVREGMKDHAESALHRALMKGEAWAVCFFLKCQAKDRGYIERTESTSEVNVKLTVAHEINWYGNSDRLLASDPAGCITTSAATPAIASEIQSGGVRAQVGKNGNGTAHGAKGPRPASNGDEGGS